MANQFVEGFKSFALSHGEKVAVGVGCATFITLSFLALSKEKFPIKPDEVKEAAIQAQTNLNRDQDDEQVLEAITVENGVDNEQARFEEKFQKRESVKVTAADFQVPRPWLVQEPGAGVMRDNLKVIPPTKLRGAAGRGGAWVYALDARGNRIEIDPEAEAAKKAEEEKKKSSRPRSSGVGGRPGMMGSSGMMAGMDGMGGPGSGMIGMPGASGATESARQKREREEAERRDQERRANRFTSGSRADLKKAENNAGDNATPEPAGPPKSYKEELRGLRWVVLTALFDNDQQRELWANALKIEKSMAYPNYKEVQVQRQALRLDGTWSNWQLVDNERNRRVTDNLPEEDVDFSDPSVRLTGTLVDRLPFLRVGFWVGSEPGELVPDEAKTLPKNNQNLGMGYGGMMAGMGLMMGGGRPGGMMSGPGGAMGSAGMMMGGGRPGGMMSGPGGGSMLGMMDGMDDRGPGMNMSSGMGTMGMGGLDQAANYPKSDQETVMVRYLDTSVDPETTYRYRIRVVLYNPNYGREDVLPGVDTASLELFSDWSEPTDPITVPADLAIHLLGAAPVSGNPRDRKDAMTYQLSLWDESYGVTIVRDFNAAPGEIVGKMERTRYADYSGDTVEVQTVPIDFASDKLMLDGFGGSVAMPDLGDRLPPTFELPPIAFLLAADGRIIIREAANDGSDPNRIEMKKSYYRELQENGKKSKSTMMDFMGMFGEEDRGAGGRN